MLPGSICYGPTCAKVWAPERKVWRRYRPRKFESWAKNAKNSKKPWNTNANRTVSRAFTGTAALPNSTYQEPTCAKVWAPERKASRRYRPPKFGISAKNAQNSKKPWNTNANCTVLRVSTGSAALPNSTYQEPTRAKVWAFDCKACRRNRPPKFGISAKNAQNSKKPWNTNQNCTDGT